MVLYLFIGDVGSGKTLRTTKMAVMTKRPVIANYKINIPNWTRLRPELMVDIDKPTFVILDEAYVYLESRLSGRDINRFWSYILFQSRKRGIDFALTCQEDDTVDKRFRNLTKYLIECEAFDEGFMYYIWKRKHGGFIGPKIQFLPMKRAIKYFGYYDTFEIVNPIDKELLYKVSENKEATVKDVDVYVEKILKISPDVSKITRGTVRDFCLRNNVPGHLMDLIYDALKSPIRQNIYKSENKSNS